ncbi:hypothetical protein [Evansella clarkii]|uniref:hypothetical protein n=1 Tax=Evansella clarkii TaxID=79879 RepID=UPI0009964C12|nr:hypothetical protein [Evansella clarkii]
MLDGAIMEYAKWFIGIVSFFFITMAVIFMFQLNEVNSFQQDVNHQIERHGGLTEEALVVLNDRAKLAYGGCLAASPEDNAPCLFEEDRNDDNVKSSGFFVREYQMQEDGQNVYYDRGENQARYGTPIHYVITREIGNWGESSFFKPSVVGTSASRVRGTASH